ncbi:MAG: ubiquinol-cytochrome c reductase iron-sulfur subunit [Candidatus Poribacteria bacterium]|nr:ubiquinol-cytochrome c reductase iron-sulfur subunit [Candidatus Poribacteria bacterium]
MEKRGNRRSFLGIASAIIGGVLSLAAGIPLIGFAISPAFKKGESKWVDLGLADRLKNSRFKKVDYTFTAKDGWVQATKKRSVYVTDTGNGEWSVFSRTCSHLGCLVRWDEKQDSFLCPCHGAIFDKNGAVVAGPPPEPLQKLETKVEAGILYVKET